MSKHRFKIQTLSVYVSTTLVLVLLGIMGLMLVVGKSLSDHVKKDFAVSVMIKSETEEAAILKYKKQLDKKRYTSTSKYISKEQVLEQQKAELGADPTEFLGYNPYEASIELSLKSEYANADSLAWIEKQLASSSLVSEVTYHKELIDAINSNINKMGVVLLVLLGLLIIISWSLISNMVRLSIYSKRFLLHTMKLVGATWGFIRRPFLIQNLWIGLFSGILANIMLIGILYLISQREPAIITLLSLESLLAVGISITLFGIFITVICAYTSVNRFLRMRGNDLYFI